MEHVADNDAALISRCQENDRDAFNEIVYRYMDRVITYVRRMVDSREDAEDLAQETFVRVYAGLTTFQSRSSLRTWVYRIATNLCIDYIRKRRRKDWEALRLEARGVREALAMERACGDTANEPETHVMRLELSKALQRAIAELPERLRTVVVLHDVNGLPYEEIAGIIGCPLGTVKSRLFHARAALRKALAPDLRCDETGPSGSETPGNAR